MLKGKRILVLGCSGSGKSTFSIRLEKITGLPLFHLDNLWWKPDRTHISRDEFDCELANILNKPAWIIDGDFSRTYEVRIRACDTVIFLDYSETVCLDGITARVGMKRPDIPWVEQKLDPELVHLVRNFHEQNRPVLLSLLQKYPVHEQIIFTNRKEADDWLERLRLQGYPGC